MKCSAIFILRIARLKNKSPDTVLQNKKTRKGRIMKIWYQEIFLLQKKLKNTYI